MESKNKRQVENQEKRSVIDDLEEEYDIFMQETRSTAGKRSALEFAKGQLRRAGFNVK